MIYEIRTHLGGELHNRFYYLADIEANILRINGRLIRYTTKQQAHRALDEYLADHPKDSAYHQHEFWFQMGGVANNEQRRNALHIHYCPECQGEYGWHCVDSCDNTDPKMCPDCKEAGCEE